MGRSYPDRRPVRARATCLRRPAPSAAWQACTVEELDNRHGAVRRVAGRIGIGRGMRLLRRILLTLLLVIGLAAGGFVAWASTPARPSAEAYVAMKSNDEVKVSLDAAGRLLFEPIGAQNGVGFILYPGARVDPRASAPPAAGIGARGRVVV